ncbi:DEAD/DEAH box helicase [Dictyobacter formicarum]|uniref:RNA helicase n=1 Tax=Dictyobacter formicarum TaxID=2778368 RepID=A0ABQ3VGV2_9CHLR|nr:DEAD/DEAH box helicase [Dictyobacter formicarum]GHO84906.1 RNA helicase [Dictyobacter formicarum]
MPSKTIFQFRDQLIQDYASYIDSFIQIRDTTIKTFVEGKLREGVLWPEPLIQLNPLFDPGEPIDELVAQGILHRECARIFRNGKSASNDLGSPLRLHRHQSEAIRVAQQGASYVLTTGTGSGKSLSYIIPIVDHVLRHGSGKGIKAIVVYPMNALANSQLKELEKFLQYGYQHGRSPVTFARYTGQESDEDRQRIIAQPPDILLTNYVMLELILTRSVERPLISFPTLQFLVLDELHTYRGRQGSDVALLVRRVRDRLAAGELQCIGTSATLAGAGRYEEQQAEVARMATQIFGTRVKAEHIIGETLVPTTRVAERDEQFQRRLTERVLDSSYQPAKDYQSFIQDPLSIWIESTFGITERGGRYVRTVPKSIEGERGAAIELSNLTGAPVERCIEAIQQTLLAGYECEPHPETGRPPFAFRLHQFISKGDTLYASLEAKRHLTLQRQQFVPGTREQMHVLLPLVFCRECGQEYYCVRIRDKHFVPRALNDQVDDESQVGFLYYSPEHPWPQDGESLMERLPDGWIEEVRSGVRVRSSRRKDLPLALRVRPDGTFKESSDTSPDGEELACHFVPAPFRFCLHCGVTYGSRQSDDFAKLASLSSEGRSTATTILSLSAIRRLREDPQRAMPAKMLSFTDNRQDASLQAGHFNDFIEVGVLRAALYHAVQQRGSEGLQHDELTQMVFTSLALPLDRYASDPAVKYQALNDTKQALRQVLGYHLYRDLKRGWRITSPNLEQCGLLKIQYRSLEDVCQDEEVWSKCHGALSMASPQTRAKVGKVLLDYMRRELAIKVDYLDQEFQERIQQRSNQFLVTPWALDENETKVHASILFPRPAGHKDYGGNVFLSARGGFGQYLRRQTTFHEFKEKLRLEDTDQIICHLLEGLRVAGLVERVIEPRSKDDVPGYQLPASAMIWLAGDGTQAFHDPIRVPRASSAGHGTNPFFVEFYRATATNLENLRAYEHTAQVPYDLRVQREEDFRENKIPILYCSPTMELGVDIAELNVVNMRNIPPTPANYAQRSGRAGRSGQPALVFTYCSTGSPHDQYFFKRPENMVAGAVTPPRLDLANEDLVRAHIHAIWLTETGLSLGRSLKDLLDVSGEEPTLELQDWVRDSIEDLSAKKRARRRAAHVLLMLRNELSGSGWYTEDEWLERVLDQVAKQFDDSCKRWRTLYRAALDQARQQSAIMLDASRSQADKDQAKRLRAEAESQLALLTDISSLEQSDFYSYRYFATEGFLPGYNFPRLPLSAYIPGRRVRQQARDEYLSRSRFLAISEFGPRAIVYHEGSRYLINRVILSLDDSEKLTTSGVKQCEHCGYLHPLQDGVGVDVCEQCGAQLPIPLRNLFRLQNVATQRREKINSDEEERVRLGYEIRTAVRFSQHEGQSSVRVGLAMPAADAASGDEAAEALAKLTYNHSARLWRINLGWVRRKNKEQHGFVLDMERGYWAKSEQAVDEPDDPLSPRTARVIPYVEDSRNCLLFEPTLPQSLKVMASLQSALKSAIQIRYQLEDNELAAEPLPHEMIRRSILFYESAEGGAGVLQRLLEEPGAMREVAREALRLCHFDPDTGEDLRRAPRAQEDCEAACYDCLLSYYNQRDHLLLDRFEIRPFLIQLAQGQVAISPTGNVRSEHLEQLLRQAGSDLEREWLHFLNDRGCRLPSHAQQLVESCGTRPDFLYDSEGVAIYIDGPHHLYPERRARDTMVTECLEDLGYFVIRFGHQQDWAAIVAQYPHIFGRPE